MGSSELTIAAMFASEVHRKLLLAGAVAMASPAMTGHPAVMNYATQVFQSVGFDAGKGSGLAVGLYVTKLLATLPDFLWLDLYDRRWLMKIGLTGIGGTYVLSGLAYGAHAPRAAAAMLLACTLFYQASVGPISWIVPAEAFPTDIIVRGSAVVSSLYAGSVFVIVQMHPWIQAHGTFVFLAVYTSSTAAARYLIHWYLPETRGRSLEDIEQDARSDRLFRELDAAQLEDDAPQVS